MCGSFGFRSVKKSLRRFFGSFSGMGMRVNGNVNDMNYQDVRERVPILVKWAH